jgi:hypothetical protein
MKKTLSIYLPILFLGLVGLSSCQENGQEEVPTQLSKTLKENDPVITQNVAQFILRIRQ